MLQMMTSPFSVVDIFIINFAVIIGCMLVLWLISIAINDVSAVDTFWALGFVIIAAVTFYLTGGDNERQLLILVITSVWGLRLGTYLFIRWRREGPDGRYVALLQRAKGNVHLHSLKTVFLTQAIMLWLVSLPVQLGQIESGSTAIGVLAYIGCTLAIIGIFFESVGDWQMAKFKADPANKDKAMDRGLWRYTRHPNYFGDTCVWWGLFLIAAETPYGIWSLFGPALLTWTLVKWSGAALLERRLKKSRAGYEDYLKRTSSFFPWPPKKI